MQAVFQHVKGVSSAVSGYAGGQASTANRHGERRPRGHAEAVEITYDPAQVSYGQLLQIYFSVAHDPTQLNRQGPDTGTRPLSRVPRQRQPAPGGRGAIAQLNRAGVYGKPMATTIEPLKAFYRAEDYHQDYLVRHPYSMYIMVNDVPKVENLAKVFRRATRTSQSWCIRDGRGGRSAQCPVPSPCRLASNRNRASVSSIQFSIRLELAMSRCSS